MARQPHDRALLALLTPLTVGLVLGFGGLWRYKQTPGATGQAPVVWPTESALPRTAEKPTLVMFAHPMCPCTVASLGELREVLSRFEGRFDAVLAFADVPDATHGSAFETASALRGVVRWSDVARLEHHRFGAKTSGHVVLYDRDGRLLFSGGITSARGHLGDNAGLDALTRALETLAPAAPSPVFGCALDEPEHAQ